MKTTSIGFIGGGRITRIFLQAFSGKRGDFEKVIVYDTDAAVCAELATHYPWIECGDIETVSSQPVVILALHPPVIMETLELISGVISRDAMVLSLAPKITINKIATRLGTKNVVRLIPNATSYIGEGYNPVTFAPDFDATVKSKTLKLLQILGKTFETEEAKLEAYAILSAMLPTYFWFQWQELCDLGLNMGLSRLESIDSVQNTLLAAIKLMFESGLTREQLVDLIPVKPIGGSEEQIRDLFRTNLMNLYARIKPS